MSEEKLRIGVIGLGRAFTLMLPSFVNDRRVELVAAADPLPGPRARFAADFACKTYRDAAELCRDADVEIVYIASPHQFHAAHAEMAAANGKHILVEKPMALSLSECRRMIAYASNAKVQLVVGHSHSFDAPILRTREHIAGGKLGSLRMIQMLNFTDFLYRARRPDELDTAQGGGVVFSQAVHQLDIARLLGGGKVKSVRAITGAWDGRRRTEGAYAALLEFECGAFASLTYSGYAHFDSDEFCGWIGESGKLKDPADYGGARKSLVNLSAEEEAALKASRNYGGQNYAEPNTTGIDPKDVPPHHQHFGFVLAACDRADLRPLPNGVMIYGDQEQYFDKLPKPIVPRVEVIDELCRAILDGAEPQHSGRWSMATMEVCHALLTSAKWNRQVILSEQVGIGE
jgi:phthalate 4,5-cis-dihydrodiol dehydrogenase